ncbi:DUF6457 domain-containing protein [Citricoccus sp. NR2]|uniref:DUF6457 domain-containing protein n=1 Tax=Citricoccus sp. NR2 TaxID=3004095 RepID=UPI0022DE3F42|nr:DUF6457 domain-containing protein [Citricoccus sp. NR2]WBL19829.1 DUF6457 domain-containing protein [Citricoccus sp. NR2]
MSASNSKHLPPSALNDWLAEVAPELGLDPEVVPIGKVLDVARDVAHGVARPAAPLTTFLVGLALGQNQSHGTSGEAPDFDELQARVTALAEKWEYQG